MAGRNIEGICRLTALQEGILFHTLESAKDGVYINQYSCDFEQDVDEDRLRQAWQSVCDRHGALRTLFTWQRHDKPLQIVRKEVELPWQSFDWRQQAEAEQRRRWTSLLARDRDRGFDLETAPLARATLVRLGDRRYRFLLSFHHILLDGWSMRLLLSEALALYAAGPGAASTLPPAPAFSSFVEWLDRQDTEAAEAHWRRLLGGFTSPTRLPLETRGTGSRPAEQRERSLAPESMRRLVAMTRAHRLTLNTAVLGAWALLLARHSDGDDVVFGSTLMGRPPTFERAEQVAGLFINTLPLRVRVDGDARGVAWLRELQAQQLDMRQFEQTPLVSVQRCSDVPAGSALFESIVVFENFPPNPADADSPDALQIVDERYAEYSNYPLALLAVPGDDLRLIAIYDPARFEPAAIDRLLEQLAAILDALAANPESPLSALPADATTPRAASEAWNGTAMEFPPHDSIHELIERAASLHPDKPALAAPGEVVDYRSLDIRANQLAHRLRERGVGRGLAVPVFMDRSVDAVVAILAVLKAGAAYIPLDATFPDTRIAHVLDDIAQLAGGRRPLVVTHAALVDRLGGRDVDALCVDRERQSLAGCPGTRPDVATTADDLAYVIYTSGSTGRPKGVMVTHANLLNSTLARKHHYPEPLSAYLLLSSLATDSSVAGLFWTLCTGALLVLPRNRQEQDVRNLCEFIAEHRVSHLLAVPSLYRLLLEDGEPRLLDCLRAAIVAGEPCSPAVVRRHEAKMPNAALYNEYGPTEATVWATLARLDRVGGTVTIGKPIANVRTYVLDEAMQPLPVGVAGELCIGGAGVARGYLNLPEATAERFVDDPFSADGGRLYRSGDRARYRPDGEIELLGRVDNQLKIRGYRVEPEEIEAVLSAHPSVSEAAVRLDKDRGDRLVACIVPEAGQAADSDALRDHVRSRLSDYMVPQAFVVADALPRTAAGKLDRAALEQLETAVPLASGRAAGAAATTDAEATLARIWQDVLALEAVGVDDNFFEVGGDSLLSIRILSQANRAGLRISPEKFFAHPTIAEQARLAEPESRVVAEQGVVSGTAPLTPIQRWFFDEVAQEPERWNQAPLFRVSRRVERLALERAVQRLVDHHDALRARFPRQDGERRQDFDRLPDEPPVDWTVLDTPGDGEIPAAIIDYAESAHRGFTLDEGPLIRFAYFSAPADEHDYLLIVAHHLVVDAVSWRILVEDLASLLDGIEQGRAVTLPAKTTALRDWARRLADYAVGDAAGEQLAYWSGLDASGRLPTDFEAGADENRVATTFTVSNALSRDATSELVNAVPRAFRTRINDALLAALAMTLTEWSGRDAVRVDLEGHGREPLFDDVDLGRTVGWLTTQYPVVLRARPDDEAAAALKTVKDELRAVPSNGIGYLLLRYLRPGSGLESLPAADLLFNYLGRVDSDGGGRLSRLAANVGPARAGAGRRLYRLEINGRIERGRMTFDWSASDRVHSRESIESLARRYLDALRRIAQAASAGETAHAPEDFPLADLDVADMERLSRMLDGLDDKA